jgi:hypothetical protein
MLCSSGFGQIQASQFPELPWKCSNCWFLSFVYMLWSMPEVTKWVLEADSSLLPTGSLGAAYKELLVQMLRDPTNKQGLLDGYIQTFQKRYIADGHCNTPFGTGNFRSFMFDCLRNNFTAISKDLRKKFEVFLHGLFDPAPQKTKKLKPNDPDPIIGVQYVDALAETDIFLGFDFPEYGLGHFPRYLFYGVGLPERFGGDWFERIAVDRILEVDMRPILSSYMTGQNNYWKKRYDLGEISREILQRYTYPIVSFDQDSMYELVFMELRPQGEGHVAAYVKSPDDGGWYYADGSQHKWARVAGPGCRIGESSPTPWSLSFYPTKFLYRKKDGQSGQSKTGLQVHLRAFSASLETLAGQCKLLTSI